MTIHGDHPFMDAESERKPVRRFRGRLPSPVGLWTSSYGGTRAGLTVSSMLVADGDPGIVVGLIDPDSDLWETLRSAKTAVVSLLGGPHQQLADAFGYVAPAPGGPFRMIDWTDTDWGPAPVGVTTWAGCRLVSDAPPEVGWSLQVHLEIAHVELLPDDQPALIHRRGRYIAL
ncbi:flavin reductase (DIM6/NTAB) family NADH-FMN oxidoreductase RutF [Kribbella sp. VKM Ac-2527]|uniref:Flavin reductase (DIM6/NTAB) family NADH-FMN oxidoreductase RutF n=1 Tax=Kribbella caucasensis TaxID=2512215 RepID=A0A4R6KSY9_9ACTN|nr:flavin reductase family protein [Kribbella sp. VKM Ac-2527]TDO54608.1 flavin reductase (DIM6/NTAB) family NADH-FMN oxidoreductase RutF [Kribbella sp. VKM Ac-2527]